MLGLSLILYNAPAMEGLVRTWLVPKTSSVRCAWLSQEHARAVTACGCLLALILFWSEMHAFFGPAKLRTVRVHMHDKGQA